MKKLLSLLSTSLFLAACGGGGGGGSSTLSIGVTDAPIDGADAVVVRFTAIELLDGGSDVVERFEFATPQSVDLLQLQGSNSQFLVNDAAIEAGEYAEIRLLVDALAPSCQNLVAPFPSYITIDGTDYPLVVPSGAQTGLKVKGPITVGTAGRTAYTIDFDLRKAIAQRGQSDCYNLLPVLRVVDNALIGTLSGTVDGDLLADSSCTADASSGEGAAVYLYDGHDANPDDAGSSGEPFASSNLVALNDGSGNFNYEIGFLLAGDYTASFTCQAKNDIPESDEDIAFSDGQNVSISADTITEEDFNAAPANPPVIPGL